MNQDRNGHSIYAGDTRTGAGPWPLAALALLATLAFAAGCGSNRGSKAEDGDVATVVAVPAYETSADAHASHAAMPGEVAVQATQPVAEAGGMPPDIIVTASSTSVTPGEVIDVVVQATPDVTEVSLWDGLNDRQALAWDADAKAWHVSYRVPLRLPWARTGLAITAKNDAQRWCRSWVFIEMQQTAPPADSAATGPAPLAEEAPGSGEK